MISRGPDDQGVYTDEDVQMGMVRLSIQDMSSAGHQPMVSEDGRYVMVFNGEIYNFKQLKEEYLKEAVFKSGSDTEVLLKLFEKKGKDSVKFLRGMFAFLIWDKQEKIIFGARDRMGIKPLLYYQKGNILALSSELRSIVSSEIVPKEINKQAVEDLFLYGSVQFPKTFIEEVYSIPPAHYFTYKNNRLTIEPYWEFTNTTNTNITFGDAVEQFKNKYEESVKLRLISDRKVGVFLSSGIDSVSILANLKKIGTNSVQTFSIGFKQHHQKFYNEAEKAADLARYFGFDPIVEYIEPKAVEQNFDDFVESLDQPSIDGFNTYLVSKLGKEHLTVALSGLGGDELLMGYPRDLNLYNYLSRSFKTSLVSNLITQQYILGEKKTLINKLSRLNNILGSSSNLGMNYLVGRFITFPKDVDKILNQFTQKSLSVLTQNYYEYKTGYKSNLANNITYNTLRSYTLSQLLRDMDVVSMSQSIEVRFPLLDHELVDKVLSFPAQYRFTESKKTNYKTSSVSYEESGMKRLLIEAYRDNLPEGYLQTPKQGFQLPIYHWLEEFITVDNIEDLANISQIKAIFKTNWLDQQIEQFKQTKKISNQLYMFIVFAKWYKQIQEI